MESEKYQKEFFEEFEPPKKAAPRFGNIFQRTDFVVSLSSERIVFASIGILMLMVVFFALGVEKGKSIAYSEPSAVKTKAPDSVPAVIPAKTAPVIITEQKPATAKTNIAPKTSPVPAQVIKQPAFDKNRPYTIVAAAFSREDYALKEVGKLKAGGLEAFEYYGEPYYLACVGSFQNKADAQKILSRVKQMHKDAYVRLR